MEKLLDLPDMSKPTGIRDKAMLELLYASGLRVSELVHLTLDNINLKAMMVKPFGKGGKERLIPLGKTAKKFIRFG